MKGEHTEEKEEKKDYLRRERSYGSFSRSMTIPVAIQAEKAEAGFENGVLTLTLPKAEEIKPKQIKVTPQARIEAKKEKKQAHLQSPEPWRKMGARTSKLTRLGSTERREKD